MPWAAASDRRAVDARYEVKRSREAVVRRAAMRVAKRGPCMLCGKPTGDRGRGPVRLYCSHRCRQRDWELRR